MLLRYNPPSVVWKELKVFVASTGALEIVPCWPEMTIKGIIQCVRKDGLNLDDIGSFGLLREKDGSWLKELKKLDSYNFEKGLFCMRMQWDPCTSF